MNIFQAYQVQRCGQLGCFNGFSEVDDVITSVLHKRSLISWGGNRQVFTPTKRREIRHIYLNTCRCRRGFLFLLVVVLAVVAISTFLTVLFFTSIGGSSTSLAARGCSSTGCIATSSSTFATCIVAALVRSSSLACCTRSTSSILTLIDGEVQSIEKLVTKSHT